MPAPARAPLELPPPCGSPQRHPWLKRLGRRHDLPISAWVRAITAGEVAPEADLLHVLAPHLDGPAAARLLAFWVGAAGRRGSLAVVPEVAGRVRHRRCAALLRRHLAPIADAEVAAAFLPLLGHQRQRTDFPLLRAAALDPGPLRIRRAALEGLALGLSAWPPAELAVVLETLARDLDSRLAAVAVDLLARLPHGPASLARLARHPLDPSVRARLERRRRAWPQG